MFIALRDLRFARGRFALMGAVIALISLLVVLLSGLSAGLSDQSVGAVRSLPADRLAFAAPVDGQAISFSSSRLDADQLTALASRPGVASAEPLGVAPTRLDVDGRETAVTAFGVRPTGFLSPRTLRDDGVVVSAGLLEQTAAGGRRLSVGDTVRVGGKAVPVVGVGSAASFNHTPVIWLPLTAWRGLDAAAGADATVAALRLATSDGGSNQDAAGTTSAGTVVTDLDGALAAVGSYTAENGSLTLMRLLLLLVGALVVGAFFTVWTIQRTPDLAVLKAIGASSRYLVRDATVQALVLLTLGGVVGTGVAAGVGVLVSRIVAFVVEPSTTVLPFVALVAVGLIGAAAAVRRVTTIDPLTALGAAR